VVHDFGKLEDARFPHIHGQADESFTIGSIVRIIPKVVEQKKGKPLKNRLAKATVDTAMSWVKVLLLVLLTMRGRTRAKVGPSPYEVIT